MTFGTEDWDDSEEDEVLARLREHMSRAAVGVEQSQSTATAQASAEGGEARRTNTVAFGFSPSLEVFSTGMDVDTTQVDTEPGSEDSDPVKASESSKVGVETPDQVASAGVAGGEEMKGEETPDAMAEAQELLPPHSKTKEFIGEWGATATEGLPGPLKEALQNAWIIVDLLARARGRLTWRQDAEVVKRETIGGRNLVTLKA